MATTQEPSGWSVIKKASVDDGLCPVVMSYHNGSLGAMSPTLPSRILDKDWRSSRGSHFQWMVPRFARRTASPCKDAHRFLFLMWGRKNRSATVTLEREKGRERETRRKYRKCKVIIGTIKNIVSSKWPIHCDDSAVLGCYLEPAVIRWQPTSIMARETALKVRAEAALRFWSGDFEREKFLRVFHVFALFWSKKNVGEEYGLSAVSLLVSLLFIKSFRPYSCMFSES